jgi:hypothetical protein
VQIDVLLADLDESRSRTWVASREPGWYAAAIALLRPMLAVIATCCLSACKPTLVVGEWECPAVYTEAGRPPSPADPVSVPWETGFEDRFCDYTQTAGFCYGDGPASFQVVSSPVHSGNHAAAFTVALTGGPGAAGPVGQARCVRQGVFPAEGYYGAWYYIPKLATNQGVWNLIHFQGGSNSYPHGLWDVSLANGVNGELHARVYDFLQGNVGLGPPVPIASWFHIVLYWRRAKDRTGEVALYQDGTRVVDFTNLVTDDSDWGQWFVGNFATALVPPESTVYVDDVTISATP